MERAGKAALVLAIGASAAAATLPARAEGRSPTVTAGLAAITDLNLARSDFVEHCAGCHGVQGRSAPAELPELHGRIGYMMCTPQSRAYLIRLPNVAQSRIKDTQQLADMMNFVIFGIGGASVLPGTKPFTAEEVAYERKFALTSASLIAERAKAVEGAIRKCHAPASMRQFYSKR